VSQGFDSILTITDQGCTKAAIFIPCNEDITAEETAALYIKHVFAHFGLPTKVISDRDPRFMSKFIQAVCKVTGVKHALSTAYHPRTNGQSERSNQWLETAIRFITDQKQKNWAPYLPIAQFAHNNWPSDTTRKSPFFLLMGFNPHADWIHATSPIPKVTLCLEQLKEACIQARDAMIKAQQSWVKHCDTPKYKEGDLVWLEGKNLRLNQPTAKLVPRRHGPFKITQVMSAVNYRLELPTQWSIHPVFHIDLLTPYKETIMHGPNFTRPAPELIDGEEEYSVEKILDSRHFGRRWRLQYLVKWTTKMPLWFRQSTITGKKLPASSPTASESTMPSLPKGWVYVPEEVEVKVEAEVIDPSKYQMLDAPRRSKCKALGPPEESCPQSWQASNTTEARLTYHSASGTSTAVKRLCITSAPTLTPLTLL
jgi:hypothetical protein